MQTSQQTTQQTAQDFKPEEMQELLKIQHRRVNPTEETTDKEFLIRCRILLGNETHLFHKPTEKFALRPTIFAYLSNHHNSVYINFQKYFNKLIIEKAKLLNGEKFEPIEIIEGKYIGFFTKIDTLRRFNIVFRECCRVVGTVKGFRITNIIKNRKKETTETKKETTIEIKQKTNKEITIEKKQEAKQETPTETKKETEKKE